MTDEVIVKIARAARYIGYQGSSEVNVAFEAFADMLDPITESWDD